MQVKKNVIVLVKVRWNLKEKSGSKFDESQTEGKSQG